MSKWMTKFAALAIVLVAAPASADNHDAAVRAHLDAINAWLNESVVIDAITEQTGGHAGLSQSDIDRLDKQWRAETKASDRPLINGLLARALSKHLKQVKADSQGLFSEIFVMDNKGLNVGQSDATSDYWQGDEAKWKKTYLAGAGAVFIDGIEHDESAQTFQSQVSLSIIDPKTNMVIGAVTDALFTLRFNFLKGQTPPCFAACDTNGDGQFIGAVTDVLATLRFNFLDGGPPAAPFPECGPGELAGDENLGCETPTTVGLCAL